MVKDQKIASLEEIIEKFQNQDAETFDDEIFSKNYEENSFITNCKNNDDLCKASCGLEWEKIDDLVGECNDLINNTTFKGKPRKQKKITISKYSNFLHIFITLL